MKIATPVIRSETSPQLAKQSSHHSCIRQEKSRYSWRTLALCSSPDARQTLPFEYALRLKALPIAIHHCEHIRTLSMVISASAYPQNLKELTFICDHEISYDIEDDDDALIQAIHASYQGDINACKDAADKANKTLLPKVVEEEFATTGPVSSLLNQLLNRAFLLGATDIHLEPHQSSYRIRLRIHGRLQQEQKLTLQRSTTHSLVRRIKVLAKLPAQKHSSCLEGAFECLHTPQPLRIRVSIFPVVHGQKVVLRLLHNPLLDSTKVVTPDALLKLGLEPSQSSLLYRQLHAQNGAILLSGPTGSGKSTLLTSCLHLLNNETRNIVTIEDPVEHLIPGVNQTEIDETQNLTYDTALPKLLRQDPDVMMVGEIRTPSSTKCALDAAVCGSLILTTIHASNCLEILIRLQQLGASPELIALSCRLLVSQRLLSKLCTDCKYSEPASLELRKIFNLPKGTQVWRASGCKKCNMSGYRGSMGVYEMIPVNPALRDALISSKDNSTVRSIAIEYGYRPIGFQVRERLLEGIISPHEALRCLGLPYHNK